MAYDTDDQRVRRPVTDWAGDWDWLDPAWGAEAPEIWQSLRDAGCDVAFTERYGRAWMPIGYDAISEVAYDTEHFSSFRVSVSHPDSPVRPAPPITSDPPEHHEHRRLLLPAFSPKAVDPLKDETRRYCRELIERLDGLDVADAAGDYSQHIPVHLIAHMVGVPESDADVFRDWIFRNFQLGPIDPHAKMQLQQDMADYFDQLLDARVAEPADDLATLVTTAEIDGQPVSPRAATRVSVADDPRRHRHHVECDRLWYLALRHQRARPRSIDGARVRRSAVADGDRGGAALLFPGDDGASSRRRHRGRRMPGAAGRAGAAHVSGRQP